MIQVERGADITEMEAPIPNTIGEGFTFCLNGKEYTINRWIYERKA